MDRIYQNHTFAELIPQQSRSPVPRGSFSTLDSLSSPCEAQNPRIDERNKVKNPLHRSSISPQSNKSDQSIEKKLFVNKPTSCKPFAKFEGDEPCDSDAMRTGGFTNTFQTDMFDSVPSESIFKQKSEAMKSSANFSLQLYGNTNESPMGLSENFNASAGKSSNRLRLNIPNNLGGDHDASEDPHCESPSSSMKINRDQISFGNTLAVPEQQMLSPKKPSSLSKFNMRPVSSTSIAENIHL